VFYLRRPSPAAIERLLADQADRPLSYAVAGVTRGDHPPRFHRNHHRTRLGAGGRTYQAAADALGAWAMYRLPWTQVWPPGAPTEPGTVMATVVRHLGFWSVNPCRIVYRDETGGPLTSVSFALGTLPAHSERGEERFRVEWHEADDSVWFEILAYAEPHHWLARLGTPYAYRLQHRFGTQALGAMQEAVSARLG
jgi:uncharacterized protein (UPF0548 family)